ncbi:hypothetical protein Hypma_003405 [Hypsizygus marmoreus]|uniref:Uncharacterized protein n=1 Tax=Hypsizygus marmoreus TaxID=39966 RepID=A0A369J273_HYPMA|nr:hypothetical protein Hypma_003405 [Hypsizygus marmoreus]
MHTVQLSMHSRPHLERRHQGYNDLGQKTVGLPHDALKEFNFNDLIKHKLTFQIADAMQMSTKCDHPFGLFLNSRQAPTFKRSLLVSRKPHFVQETDFKRPPAPRLPASHPSVSK